MAGVLLPMLFGGESVDGPRPVESRLSLLPPFALASATLVMGLYLPSFLTLALHRAAGLLGG